MGVQIVENLSIGGKFVKQTGSFVTFVEGNGTTCLKPVLPGVIALPVRMLITLKIVQMVVQPGNFPSGFTIATDLSHLEIKVTMLL
jgi:hypothetical protein